MLRQPYNEEDLFKDSTMTFGEHLEELRMRLFKAIIGLVIGFVVGLYFGDDIVKLIQSPLTDALRVYYREKSLEKIHTRLSDLRAAGTPLPQDDDKLAEVVAELGLEPKQAHVSPHELLRVLQTAEPEAFRDVKLPAVEATKLASDGQTQLPALEPIFIWQPIDEDLRIQPTSLSVQEPFSIFIKASLLFGIVVSSWWVFYQIWAFVAAGLYPHEKRYVHVFLPFSVGLFLAGVALAFFFVFQPVLGFLFSFNDWLGIAPDPRISEWLSFVLILPLGFGIAFQLPLVMLFLERIGIFDVKAYLSKWRISVLVIFVISMILTPADPYSMLLMAVPLTFLYFGGVALCRLMPRHRSPFDEPIAG
jgi:sec-independent protein translocase protein TatC